LLGFFRLKRKGPSPEPLTTFAVSLATRKEERMKRRSKRIVTFSREEDRLIRKVVIEDGRTYAHSCGVEVFREVLYAIESASRSTTLMELADSKQLPYTQVNVAMEFLKERGLLEVVRRRSVSASPTLFEDGMTEFYAQSSCPP